MGPYIDLFCSLSHDKTARGQTAHEIDERFLKSCVARLLMLDSEWLARLVSRQGQLRSTLEIDLAEHLKPLVDAVVTQQLERGTEIFETPAQFILRRDDPERALLLAERFLDRTRREIGDATWSEERRPPCTWMPARRLRVGYVCSDLTFHPVGLSIRGLMVCHDKSRFEIFVYDRTPKPDRTVAGPVELGADIFRHCLGMSSEEMRALVQKDGIDILVDLSGAALEFEGTVFARPVAPARVGMLGYPGAMGHRTVDYTVVDADAVPDSERAGFSERLIVMPGSFLPLDDSFSIGDAPPTRAEIGLPEDAFVLAAFNRSGKVAIDTVRLWMACLKRIPRAVLWLSTDDTTEAVNARALFERVGLSPDRLVVSEKVSVLAHARRHVRADVSLDPLGYNGGYSTALSLHCGVPVVSRPGRCFAWRMSAGLLRQAGLLDCVVDTPGRYLEQVARIAEDAAYAKSLRDKLTPAEISRKFATKSYVAALETAFMAIAEQHRQGAAPSDIVV
jgi:predicted O-linked N-acetylglucosamine transferase (SPINDLY family)